jgi:hypothetical protein
MVQSVKVRKKFLDSERHSSSTAFNIRDFLARKQRQRDLLMFTESPVPAKPHIFSEMPD